MKYEWDAKKEIMTMVEYSKLQNGSDIRGVALPLVAAEPVNLTEEAAGQIGRAFAAWLVERCGKPAEELRIAVGRDSRLSGPSLQRAVLTGLVAMGAVAADCGMASTPAMFMATVLPGCDFDGAVMITASHLPQNRNGLKFFTREGGLESADIKELLRRAEAGPEAARLHGRLASFDILTPYTAMLRQRIITGVNGGERPLAGLKIAVDAGNGAGGFYATRVLAPLGADISASVYLEPDGSFPTVKAPNPEDPNAFTLAFDLANKTGANLILATDPDSDRLGAAVRRRDGRFQVLTGNQIGSILIHYILSTRNEQGTLPGNGLVVRSIVSTRMADAICAYYGVELREVLTGFRFISEQIAESLETKEHTFLFGFEESYGFLSGCFSRDKDAICAAMLLAEAATVYEFQGESLYDVLQEMYAKYGFYGEAVKSYTLKGKEGLEKIAGAMRALRADKIAQFGGVRVVKSEDIQTGTITYPDGREEKCPLPKSNVLRYFTEGDGWLCVRPSGTEPKLKLYIGAKGSSEAELKAELSRLMTAADGMISELLK